MRSRSDEPDALTESGFDRELKAALDVEPSPELVARVRTRLSGEPEPSAWSLPWLVAAAGAIAIVVAAVVVTSRFDPQPVLKSADLNPSSQPTRPAPVDVEATSRSGLDVAPPQAHPGTVVVPPTPETVVARTFSPREVLRTAVARAEVVRSAVSGSRVAQRPTVTGSTGTHLEVLISPDEVRGLRRLIAMANEEDANLGPLLAEPTILATVGPEGEITVPPISIDPLVSEIDSDTF